MLDPRSWLFLALAIFLVGFVGVWIVLARRQPGDGRPGWLEAAVGFGTNFFDTLGIGSFATTTAVFRLKKMIDDRIIPGTLNVGHTVPVIVQAFIYTAIVQVDFTTLVALIVAAVAGAWLGAGVVAAWPKRAVQLGMGSALFVAAVLMFMTQLQLFPGGGDSLALGGPKLWVGIAGNFVLGALMTLGIGLYAPCMIMVSLLGMNPTVAFPIMMGSCAFLMPIGGLKFVQAGSYSLRNALGLTLGGVPGVLIAAYLVTSMPLGAVRWLVIVVVLYSAIGMLRAALDSRQPSLVAAGTPDPDAA